MLLYNVPVMKLKTIEMGKCVCVCVWQTNNTIITINAWFRTCYDAITSISDL
jgi:hypothetical protein